MIANYVKAGLICLCALGISNDSVPQTSGAPVTILIEERPDSVRISYDRMASHLAPYGNSDALRVGRELDAKVERILTAAAK